MATPAADAAPDAMDPKGAGPDKTALLTFLSASDWTARRDLVLHAEHVAPQMEALATTRGDGPIKATRITVMHRDEQPPFPRPPIRPDGWLRGLPQKQIPSS